MELVKGNRQITILQIKVIDFTKISIAFFIPIKYNKYEKYNKQNSKETCKMEKDKYVGICKVGEKGQIVIPVEARKIFDIKPGDSIIVLCDKERGLALVKSDIIEDLADDILKK